YYVTSQVVMAANLDEARRLLQEVDLATTTIIEADQRPEVASGSGSINLLEQDDTQTTFETESTSPHLLVWQQTHYPGWQAFVDDQTAQILPANVSFQAVLVPSGKHQVTFRYIPQSLQ